MEPSAGKPPARASGVIAAADDQRALSAGFRWTVLQRHGKRPLAVLARTLLQANNRCAGLPHWSEISIHETAASRFTAALRHISAVAPGAAWCDAWLCESPDAVRTMFYAHDPIRALPLCSRPHETPGAALADMPSAMDGAEDAAAMSRFSGAWAGLLGAVFGLRPQAGA